jgi:hypothetical protein
VYRSFTRPRSATSCQGQRGDHSERGCFVSALWMAVLGAKCRPQSGPQSWLVSLRTLARAFKHRKLALAQGVRTITKRGILAHKQS